MIPLVSPILDTFLNIIVFLLRLRNCSLNSILFSKILYSVLRKDFLIRSIIIIVIETYATAAIFAIVKKILFLVSDNVEIMIVGIPMAVARKKRSGSENRIDLVSISPTLGLGLILMI